jgi:uncharacterized protein involved in response to NO
MSTGGGMAAMTARISESPRGGVLSPCSALWSSGFRPFYLAACLYGPLALGLWAAAHFGADAASPHGRPAWHAHEMLLGFVAALCAGFILTALPSWAGTPEVRGRRLMALAAIWAAGRVAILAAPVLPAWAVAAADLAFLPALMAVVGPQVWRVADRRYRLVLPILGMQAAGNLAYHAGALAADPALAHQGIRLAYWGLVIQFSFVAGILTPIFTENHLRETGRASGRAGGIGFVRRLEILAPAALLAVAACELAGLGAAATAAICLVAAFLHATRMGRWRSRGVLASALLAPMHFGYFCLVLSLVLEAAAAAGLVPAAAPVHAFTIGAMGLTKLSLMVRVALKHTGRPLRVPPAMVAAMAGMGLAALGRIASEGDAALAASAVLWCAAVLIYLGLHGRYLVTPSLPRGDRK